MSPDASLRTTAALVLASATLIVFWPVLGNDFVVYDDRTYVTNNPHVRGGISPDGLLWSLTASRAANWHPLTWISHMLDWQLYGDDPMGHHLTSLLLHLVNALLLFFLLDRLTGEVWRSAFVAALFALHPLHVESVAWIAERKDLLSTCLGLLATLAYVRYARRPGAGRYLPVMLLLALGLAAKPMLVTLPFVLLLLDYWPLRRLTWKRVWEKIPLFALAAASSVVTLVVQRAGGATRSVEGFPLPERLFNAVVAYATYLWKTVWPRDLAVFYPHPGATLAAWKIGLSALVLIAITAVAVRARRSRPYLIVGWLWYLGMLVPVIGLVQVGSQSMADRYTYLPLIGLFVIVAWVVGDVLPRPGAARLAVPAAIALVALSWSTRAQLGVWRSSETLFEHALAVTERNYVARNNLGLVLAERGLLDEAVTHYEAALSYEPDHAPLHVNLANARLKQARADEAFRHYRRALELDPDSADANYNLGLALARQGRFEEAVARYEKALRAAPEDPELHNNLGSSLARLGAPDEAVEHFTRAIRLRPDYARAHANLAGGLFLLGRYEEAWAEVRAARRLGFEPPAELVRALAEKMPEP